MPIASHRNHGRERNEISLKRQIGRLRQRYFGFHGMSRSMLVTETSVDLTADLKDLVRLATSEEVDDLVRRGLDWISRLAPYDLATLFVLREAKLVVRAARGRPAARARSPRRITSTATAIRSTACSIFRPGTRAWSCRCARAIAPSASSPSTGRSARP